MGKTIGIISIKGGVGKTSSVAALGAAIANFNKKVLIIDANFSAPNLGLHLGIVNPKITLHHVLRDKAKAEDAIYKYKNMNIMPASLLDRQIKKPLTFRKKIEHLKKMYDFILIDSSPSLNNETLAAMMASDELLVVTTPDYPTLSTTMRAIRIAKQRKTPIIGVIINKVYNKNFELTLEEIEEAAESPVLAVLPHDTNVLEALANTTPLTNYSDKTEVAVEYTKLAAALIGEKYTDNRFKAILKQIFSKTPQQDVNRTVLRDLRE
ncbi:AAA family ATPase [Candidatus Woesearchaeota archaeon]|nr:AAA family ATPase [Candidatus Woesearchaeota archaeon]